ncbi:hypothetical protein F511_46179 [Dorcoceras hygrometricum]|uniref:Uncharacterized protein n=1 Tax=Dorcoceras hygrometricum TaxID=472368 RepID=A0A2Z6ZU84_9LAMI|nr:hypothetical protein F511_46179 [Dorcoceras hygrometricum]
MSKLKAVKVAQFVPPTTDFYLNRFYQGTATQLKQLLLTKISRHRNSRYLTTDTSRCSQQISALPLNETSSNHQTLYSQKNIKNDAASTNQNDTASL